MGRQDLRRNRTWRRRPGVTSSMMYLRINDIGLRTYIISHFAAFVPARIYRGSEAMRQCDIGAEEKRASGCDIRIFTVSIWKSSLPQLLHRWVAGDCMVLSVIADGKLV